MSTDCAVAMNRLSENNMPEEAVSVAATGARGPESAGVWVPILSSASLSGCTCWPSSELTSSGNTHSIRGLREPKYDCSSSASSGPAITPAAQYGLRAGPWNWRSGGEDAGVGAPERRVRVNRDHDSRDQDGDLE